MKTQYLGITLTTLILSSCTSVTDDMINNQFLTVNPVSQQKEIVGYWTGTVGPSLATLKIKNDGNAVMCSSFANNFIEKVKLTTDMLYSSSGSRFSIKSISPEKIVFGLPYFGGGDKKYIFTPDPSLKNASLFCADSFKSKKDM